MTEFDELYRAPTAPTTHARSLHVAGAYLKWVYAAIVALGTTIGLAASTTPLSNVAANLQLAGLVSLIVAPAVGLFWLYRIWSEVPEEDRYQTPLGRISAGGAIGRLFFPFYNFYWAFSVHTHLANAISASLHKRGVEVTSNAYLAYIAMALTIVGRMIDPDKEATVLFIIFGFANTFWFAYMARSDALRRIMVLAWQAERERVQRS